MNVSPDDGGDLIKGTSNNPSPGGGPQSLQLFDFISTKMDLESPMNSSSSLTLTPIELIDPSDYGIDDNNNNFVTVAPMKSILDEMIHLEPGDHTGVNGGSLELLGTFHWGDTTNSSNSSSSVSLSLMSPSGGILPGGGGWATQAHLLHAPSSNETEVQTLTTLMTDPLFVSFEDSILMKPHQDHGGDSSATSPSVISSDLISTTYREKSLSTVWPSKEDIHPHHHNNDPSSIVPSSPSMCDDSLLRSALQAIPSNKGHKQEGPLQGMSELRKVLSYPPLPNITEMQVDGPFYEFKILSDGVTVEDDSFLPNVEELIMTRNDPSFSSAALNRLSTSNNNNTSSSTNNNNKSNNALSAKWTYTTTTTSSNQNSEGTKRKRSKIMKEIKKESSHLSESSKDNNSSSPGSPAGESGSGGGGSGGGSSVRKERSLHYCTMCAKGFKDKYSVNVHVRTHTGEKPFACTTCGKSFRQKAHLAKHYQTHAAKGNSNNTSNSKNKSNSNGQSSSSNKSSSATPTFS